MSWRDDATTLQCSQAYLETLIREGKTDEAKAYVKDAYRDRARESHPDVGGNADDFRSFEVARRRLVAWIDRPRNCFECRGTGRVATGSGLRAREVRCPTCRGTGKHQTVSGGPSIDQTTK